MDLGNCVFCDQAPLCSIDEKRDQMMLGYGARESYRRGVE